MIQLKGGYYAHDIRLGRFPEFDERSRNFRAVSLLPDKLPVIQRKTWRLGIRLDQGETPKCVSRAFTHEFAAEPKERKVTDVMADEWYIVAQDNDEWPGHDYEGTSTLGGAKAGVLLKKFEVYNWCFGLEDVINVVLHLGPVVTGTNWYRRMFEPDEKGFLLPEGMLDGGHEWLIRGVNVPQEYFTMTNSWSRSWGKNGDARISFKNYAYLLEQDGDACYITH